MTKLLPLLALPLLAVFLLRIPGPAPAAAAGPCGTSHDALDADETAFLALLQQWRDTNLSVSSPLQPSGALNAAAAWFAEYQATHGAPGGHYDNVGRSWGQRALDCGYTGTTSTGQSFALLGSGEGVFGVAASGAVALSPAQALSGITYAGSGVYMWTSSTNLPAKCVGVATSRNAAGTAVSWVALIAQYPAGQACPGAIAGPSPTVPATATPTVTPTPTPSPTPTVRYGVTVTIAKGTWALVTLPAGHMTDVLARAQGCFEAVYQWQADGWRRYAPGVPGYANNLTVSNGGAFWIRGSSASCPPITL